jgi:magnesium transporter
MSANDPFDIDIVLQKIRDALSTNDWQSAVALIEVLRTPDQAGVFSDLPKNEQDELLPRFSPEDSADILEELEDEEAAEIATRLDAHKLAVILDHMEPDEAADLLGDISEDQASRVISEMVDVQELLPLLAHDDETAGGLMTSVEITLDKKMRAEEAISYLRTTAPDSESIYYLFIVDKKKHLAGVVSLRQLVVAAPEAKIETIMDPNTISIHAGADQEEAARLMARYDLLALPVVDDDGCLLGLITHDDSVEVLEEEATEDIYRLGGVPSGQVTGASVPGAMRSRLPWLVLNLATAMASATVLSLFEDTIAQVAALAVFFPIVAGVSGSAATQTLTVTVRGLALGDITLKNGAPTILREVFIGALNGLAVGSLVAVIAMVWKKTPILGAVVGAATLMNMICAGIAGVIVPLVIQRLKIDPALGSPILVTTTTDTLGYLIYLGLATMVIVSLV